MMNSATVSVVSQPLQGTQVGEGKRETEREGGGDKGEGGRKERNEGNIGCESLHHTSLFVVMFT